MPRRNAKYICFEGMDGSGKSTQSKLLADAFTAQGKKVLLLSEPSDSPLGKKIGEMIRSKRYSKETIALAFAADRMILKEDVLTPAFDEYDYVITDRNYLSSLVYQPIMGCDMKWILDLNKYVAKPDLTFIVDISVDTYMQRRGETDVIFEKQDFQQKVRKGYRSLQSLVMDDIVFLDGEVPIQETHERIVRLVSQL
jgi:dTMP kinase